jgi:hypothetical protein
MHEPEKYYFLLQNIFVIRLIGSVIALGLITQARLSLLVVITGSVIA